MPEGSCFHSRTDFETLFWYGRTPADDQVLTFLSDLEQSASHSDIQWYAEAWHDINCHIFVLKFSKLQIYLWFLRFILHFFFAFRSCENRCNWLRFFGCFRQSRLHKWSPTTKNWVLKWSMENIGNILEQKFLKNVDFFIGKSDLDQHVL